MNQANDGRFLGLLGFLGFLGFLSFQDSPEYSHLAALAGLSLCSLGSLLVFVPRRRSKVKVAIAPKRKEYLGFLGSPNPGGAGLAGLAIMSGLAIDASIHARSP